MKTLLLLLSLSAVGFGQATATSKVALKPYNKCVERYYDAHAAAHPSWEEMVAACEYKLPKPKPSVKPIAGLDHQPETITVAKEFEIFTASQFPKVTCDAGAPEQVCDPKGSVQVWEPSGSSSVKLRDDEYSHLQQLRASVVEEEKRLAVKYGANLGLGYCSGDVSAMRAAGCFADHYEFHGQFLLIDKEGK